MMTEFFKILHLLMAGTFIVFGLLLITNIISFSFETHYRIILGVIFMLYGIYRIIPILRN
jgi:hypothetical protein